MFCRAQRDFILATDELNGEVRVTFKLKRAEIERINEMAREMSDI